MNLYDRYKPKNVLNVCSGWSGFVIGASAMNIPKITAIDNNKNLFLPYSDMIRELNKYSSSDIKFINGNALTVDISDIHYDMVICSPPYYNKEIYAHLPAPYDTKHQWEQSFYIPLFKRVWEHLEVDGRMVINVPIEIYDKCLVPLFGEADDKILLPKYRRNNKYQEFIYVYNKINE
jgi:tRNA1(Val) A37 N6-methylase TrmN6